MRRQASLAAVLLCASLVAGSACNTSSKPTTGEVAPDFVLQSIKGPPRKLSSYRGKVVLVNLWATWCPPCLEELPVFDQLSAEFADEGLVVLGIAGDEDVQAVLDFLDRRPVNFEILLDPRGVIGTQYAITGYPETFFVDREGRLRDKIIGPVPHHGRMPDEALTAKIRELLG